MDNQETVIDKPLSLMDHLEELRNRIIISLVLIIVCSCLVYSIVPQIMNMITKPVGKLYFMNPMEAFWVQVKLAFFIGLYCSLPFIFYQVWKFVELGLRQSEKRFILPLAISSFMLFSIGGSFCYFLVIPIAVKFLMSYGTPTLIPLISVSEYLGFVGSLVFAFGITFQLPLVLMFLASFGIVDQSRLRKFRGFAILGSFIIGGALTPTPDMINQTLLAVPLIILYEISILLIAGFKPKAVN